MRPQSSSHALRNDTIFPRGHHEDSGVSIGSVSLLGPCLSCCGISCSDGRFDRIANVIRALAPKLGDLCNQLEVQSGRLSVGKTPQGLLSQPERSLPQPGNPSIIKSEPVTYHLHKRNGWNIIHHSKEREICRGYSSFL